MDKVKKLVEAGASLPTAIKEAVGTSMNAFAAKHGLDATIVSAVINCIRRPTDAVIAALVSELGGTPDEWRMLLWEAAKPVVGEPEVSEAEVA